MLICTPMLICMPAAATGRQVRAVRLRRDRIAVALEHKVLLYNFADLKMLHQIETLANSGGLLAISSAADSTVLACPGLHTGQVRAGRCTSSCKRGDACAQGVHQRWWHTRQSSGV